VAGSGDAGTVEPMDSFIDLITSFPVVVFTALVAISFAWMVVSLLIGGDSDADADLDGDVFDFGGMPLSIAITAIALGGFIVSALLTVLIRSLDLAGTLTFAAGLGVLAVALAAGWGCAKTLSRHLGPLYDTLQVPAVDAAVGARATVRTGRLDGDGGEVVVTSGPVTSTVLSAVSVDGTSFVYGDEVLVIGVDDNGTWLVGTTPELH
jgi:hypothetical protein